MKPDKWTALIQTLERINLLCCYVTTDEHTMEAHELAVQEIGALVRCLRDNLDASADNLREALSAAVEEAQALADAVKAVE